MHHNTTSMSIAWHNTLSLGTAGNFARLTCPFTRCTNLRLTLYDDDIVIAAPNLQSPYITRLKHIIVPLPNVFELEWTFINVAATEHRQSYQLHINDRDGLEDVGDFEIHMDW